MGFFENIPLALPDPILGLTAAFEADPRPNKVNLSVGYYRTSDLKTPIMQVVKKAENELFPLEKKAEYLPIDGDPIFAQQTGELTFGKSLWSQSCARIASMQAVGGTGALHVGGEFLKHEKVGAGFYLSDPTWANHKNIFSRLGFLLDIYPYYDLQEEKLDFEKTLAFFSKLKAHSIVLLHASCHNPTGADFSLEEWRELSSLFLRKKLIPFFDMAYQGFDKGVDADAESVRLFLKEGHEMLVACSYSKNFSLYRERVGTLFIVGESHKIAEHIRSKVRQVIRADYSNPPSHGAQIVKHVLGSEKLKREWEDELFTMRERISEMRSAFTRALVTKSRKRDFNFLSSRSGLFCYTGLTVGQVENLSKKHAIYMTSNGRINVAGLNSDNIDYVANAIVHETS